MARRYLVVDDSETELGIMQTLLRRALRDRCEVDAVQTAAAAESLLRERQYEAVIADIHLGTSSGIDVCETAREVQPRARRILVTADHSIETLQVALNRSKFHSYLSKGWGSERMLDQLERSLE